MLDDRVGGGAPTARPCSSQRAGDGEVPAWRGVRTAGFSDAEHANGRVELFDLVGNQLLAAPTLPSCATVRYPPWATPARAGSLATSLAVLLEDDLGFAVP